MKSYLRRFNRTIHDSLIWVTLLMSPTQLALACVGVVVLRLAIG
jgi:hypothetical protein